MSGDWSATRVVVFDYELCCFMTGLWRGDRYTLFHQGTQERTDLWSTVDELVGYDAAARQRYAITLEAGRLQFRVPATRARFTYVVL
jgi:hypothetical protein